MSSTEEETAGGDTTATQTNPITYPAGSGNNGGLPGSGASRGGSFWSGVGNFFSGFANHLMGESPGESLQGGQTPTMSNNPQYTGHADYTNPSRMTSMPQGTISNVNGTLGGVPQAQGAPLYDTTLNVTKVRPNDEKDKFERKDEGAHVNAGDLKYLSDDIEKQPSTVTVPSATRQILDNKFTSIGDKRYIGADQNQTFTNPGTGVLFPYSNYKLNDNTTSVTRSFGTNNRLMVQNPYQDPTKNSMNDTGYPNVGAQFRLGGGATPTWAGFPFKTGYSPVDALRDYSKRNQ